VISSVRTANTSTAKRNKGAITPNDIGIGTKPEYHHSQQSTRQKMALSGWTGKAIRESHENIREDSRDSRIIPLKPEEPKRFIPIAVCSVRR
jgi:hypothetical protein